MPLLALLVVLALVALIAVALSRANELFCVSVRDGRCLVVRGQIPTALLQDFRDVVARAGLPRATIRGVREGGRPRLLVSGADDFTAQRLRNPFGASRWGRVAGLEAAPAERRDRNLGQLLGIAWLAWLLTRDR